MCLCFREYADGLVVTTLAHKHFLTTQVGTTTSRGMLIHLIDSSQGTRAGFGLDAEPGIVVPALIFCSSGADFYAADFLRSAFSSRLGLT